MSKQSSYKQHEIEYTGDLVDHTSNLPDDVIHHILSFMPTKEAVKTSILSRRWKNLWTCVPNIDFDDELLDTKKLKDVTSFVNFVERVLRLHDASNMKKFCLSFNVFPDAFQIHAWIFYAIMHNVQELDICLFPGINPSVIPQCVFNSTSLVSLKIDVNEVELPSHISFPCLKTLHLSFLIFPDEDYADKLFSNTPVLENLVLSDCMWLLLETILISMSTLKSLTIDDQSYYEPRDDTSGCKIKIDAPKLTCFEYIGHLSSEIILNNVPSMVKACIHIPLPQERQKEVGCRAMDLLNGLQNVVSLSLSNDTMETLICTDGIPFHFPLFSNLIHLVLNKEIKDYTLRALMEMLYFSPILQSICLSEGFEDCLDFGEKDRLWLLIPMCMSNCLKTVTFKNFSTNDSEICFIKHVLKYACVLERMNICWSKTRLQDLKKQIEVRKELETTERSSTACVVKFS